MSIPHSGPPEKTCENAIPPPQTTQDRGRHSTFGKGIIKTTCRSRRVCHDARMFENQPPPDLQWVDIFLSAIAFLVGIVTLPTAFQMWWGKPRLQFEFERKRIRDGVGLNCSITNEPVSNRILKWAGVIRHAANKVRITVTIRDNGTRQFVAREKTPIKVENEERSYSVDLYPSSRSLVIIVMQNDGSSSGEIDAPGSEDGKIDIPPGEYECTLGVKWGQDSVSKTRVFYINKNVEATRWRE